MASFFLQNKLAEQFVGDISQNFGISTNVIISILAIVLLWSAVWKLLGLWKSARAGSWIWFIVLALTNTVGILPILYIYVFSKIDWKNFVQVEVKRNPKKSKKKVRKKKVQKKKK